MRSLDAQDTPFGRDARLGADRRLASEVAMQAAQAAAEASARALDAATRSLARIETCMLSATLVGDPEVSTPHIRRLAGSISQIAAHADHLARIATPVADGDERRTHLTRVATEIRELAQRSSRAAGSIAMLRDGDAPVAADGNVAVFRPRSERFARAQALAS